MEQVETITLPLDVVKTWRDNWERESPYASVRNLCKAIDDVQWTPPVTEVKWIECREHPRPANKKVMYQYPGSSIVVDSFGRVAHVGRWAIIKGID